MMGERLPWFCYLVTNLCLILFATPWTVTNQAPLSMGFPWHEYWSGLPFPCSGDLYHSGNWTQVSCLGRSVLYCWASSVTLICNGVNFTLQLLMCVFELPISHILSSRKCRKSTKNWSEGGADQRAIGSHNANRLISLVKVCVHTCVRSMYVPPLSGWGSIRQESAKNMRLWFCYKN